MKYSNIYIYINYATCIIIKGYCACLLNDNGALIFSYDDNPLTHIFNGFVFTERRICAHASSVFITKLRYNDFHFLITIEH